jgi:hypothetical protein
LPTRRGRATGLRQEQIGGTCRDNFQSQPGDIGVHEHWHSSGFANTDPDLQLTQAMHAAHVINGPTYAHVIITPAELVVDLTEGLKHEDLESSSAGQEAHHNQR